jgi:WD40 repeat protein
VKREPGWLGDSWEVRCIDAESRRVLATIPTNRAMRWGALVASHPTKPNVFWMLHEGTLVQYDTASGIAGITIDVVDCDRLQSAPRSSVMLLKPRDGAGWKLLDVETGATVHDVRLPSGTHAQSFSPDGTLVQCMEPRTSLATGESGGVSSSSQMLTIRDAVTGELRATLQTSTMHGWGAFSPDATRIVCAGSADVFDTRTGAVLGTLEHGVRSTSFAMFTPDGNRIIAASHAGSLAVWDATTFRRFALLPGAGLTSMLADGTVVAIGSDRIVRIYEPLVPATTDLTRSEQLTK